MLTERIENVYARFAEIARCFLCSRYVDDRSDRLHPANAFVVHKEKRLLRRQRPAERSAEIILHQELSTGILVETASIQRAVAQELVSSPVKLGRAAFRDDVDLA